MGLHTPTILGGNSYPSWFYDRGAIQDQAHTGTSKGLSQAINRGPIRQFQPKYTNVYVTIQSHGRSSGARTHYVTANGVRNRLRVNPVSSRHRQGKQLDSTRLPKQTLTSSLQLVSTLSLACLQVTTSSYL